MQENKTFTGITLNLGMWKSVACFPGDGGWERPSTCKAIVAVGWRPRYPGEGRFRRFPCPAPPAAPLPPSVLRAPPGRTGRAAPQGQPRPRPARRPRRVRTLVLRAAHGAGRAALRAPPASPAVQSAAWSPDGSGGSRAAGAARPGSPRRPVMRFRREMLKPP